MKIMEINVIEFTLALLKILIIAEVSGIYCLTITYMIILFFKTLDWIFRR